MAIYATDEQLYSCFQTLFQRIAAEDEAAAESLLKSKLSIRFQCSEPTAAITIDAKNKPVDITYGPTRVKQILDINLSADTLHEILLGEIGLSKAMGSGRMKPKDKSNPSSFKVRRAKVGGFVDYFEDDQAEKIARIVDETLSPVFRYGRESPAAPDQTSDAVMNYAD